MIIDTELLLKSPEIPEQAFGNFQNQPTVLSTKTKQCLVEQIQTADPTLLKKTLITAAICFYQFPSPLQQKIAGLQLVYKEHQSNNAVSTLLKQTIETYIDTEGCIQFQNLLKEQFIQQNWNSAFLSFLAKQLKIQFENEPLVEAAIQDGKIYWRIVQGHEVLYDRATSKGKTFDFEKTNLWQMDWKTFRLFKDSGKRSSTIAITKDRFITYFKEKYQNQAGFVWEELKQKGILNTNNKLSREWRIIVNEHIALISLIKHSSIISKNDVKDCLTTFCGKPIPKDTFIEKWSEDKKYRAALIWNYLKKQKILDKKNEIKNLSKLSIAPFLTTLHLNYEKVTKALYEIANQVQHCEKMTLIPNAEIYRFERTPKNWAETTRIQNNIPTDTTYCTKLWDVSIYDDLTHHRNTDDEQQSNQTGKLNYDHIPSSDALKDIANSFKIDLEKNIENHREEMRKLSKQIETRFYELHENTNIILTRNRVSKSNDDIIQTLDKKRDNLKKKISQLESQLEQIENEIKGHGNYWWAIAIPEKLHKQGETFLQSSQDQKKSSEHAFLKDTNAYFDILEKRAKDFSFTLDDYLKALGAFRYLYRCQTKSAIPIDRKYSIGIIPSLLFNNATDRKKIDKLFEEKIKYFLEQKEGIKSP